MKDAPTVTTDNPSITTNISVIDADCGEAGSQTIRVYLNTETEGEIDGKIIIDDPLSTARLEIPVSATVVKSTQVITWAPTTDILTTGTVNFNAISTSNLEVSYELTAGSDVATLEAGVLTILKEGDFTITAKQDGNEYYDAAQVVPVEFHVTRAIPAITVMPVAEDITLPAKLKDVILSNAGSAAVAGSFAWTDENTKVVDGTNNYSMTFHPTNSAIYDDAVFNVSIKATRGTQSIVWDFEDNQTFPCSAPITFDAQATSGLKVTYTSSNESIAKVSDSGELLVQNGGTVTIYANQVGDDDYLAAAQESRTLTLEKRTPIITTIPTAADIYVTNPLLESGLTDGVATIDNVSISGSWSWQNTGYYPPAGKNSYTVVFTPANTILYETTTCLVEVNVKKFKQEISWGFANNQSVYVTADINFTGSNAASATSEVEVRYTTSSPEIAYVNNQNHLVILGAGEIDITATPDENDHYESTSLTHHLTINRLLTTVMANPAAVEDLTYGQALNATDVVGGTVKGSDDAVLEGTWAWNNGAETLNAGNGQVRGVTFTPNDSHWYATATSTATVNVNKANPEVTPQASAITYGQPISASSLTTKTGNVDGSWSWAVDATQVLSVGNHDLKANFSSNDANYNNLSNVDVTLTVNKIETLNVDVPLSFCAGGSETFHGRTYTEAGSDVIEATGATRDTVYNVTVTILQPTVGADSKTITVGAEETWNGTDLSGYAVGEHSVVAVLTNAAGCDSTVTLTLTVNPLINEFTGNGDWNDASNWTSGVVPQESAPDVIINGDLIINGEVTVGNLTIEKDSRVVLTVTGDLTVNGISEDREEYGNMYVENGGEVEVNGSLAVGDLTVEASIGTANGSAESGQVVNAENIVYANAYIEINMDPSGILDDTKWYGFTVPFDVDAREGISRKENGVYRQCTYGTHYMFAEYDANKRLNSGKGWKYITGNTLQAGTFYYLTVDGNYNTYRFKAKNATYTQAASATLVMNGSTSNPNANWNAVGNSTLQHVTASFAGGEYVQVYMNGKDAYKTVHTDEATFVVGCPFFIQAKEATTLMLNEQNSSTEKYYAPHRMSENSNAVARINLSSADGGYSDQIYFSAADKEQDAYIIGQDLSKAGESKVVPQLWMAQYNQKLSVHEAVLSSNSATCPLGIFVPQAGSYTLDVDRAPENVMLYLTYNGRAIWNLTYSPYVFDLTKGTTEGYGLKMYVMQVATDVETVSGERLEVSGNRKVLIDDVIYIVTPEGKMYDITGKSANY